MNSLLLGFALTWGMIAMFLAFDLGVVFAQGKKFGSFVSPSMIGFSLLSLGYLVLHMHVSTQRRPVFYFRQPRRNPGIIWIVAAASVAAVVFTTIPNFELERIAINAIGLAVAILPMLAVAKWQRWIVTTLPPGHPLVDWSGKPDEPTTAAPADLEIPHP